MTQVRIWKDIRFEAAHWLPEVPADHPCARMHGHSYRVRLVLAGEVRSDGFVREYEEVGHAVAPVIARLDHHILNETISNPTVEHLAIWLVEQLRVTVPELVEVVVQETATAGARVFVADVRRESRVGA